MSDPRDEIRIREDKIENIILLKIGLQLILLY